MPSAKIRSCRKLNAYNMASPLCAGKKNLMLITATMLILHHSAATTDASGESSQAKDSCQDKCGNVSIPYPFGIGKGCSLEGFEVVCPPDNVPILLLNTSNSSTPLLGINLTLGEARVQNSIAQYCNFTNNTDVFKTSIFVAGPSFTVSGAKNKFTAIGCATVASIFSSPESSLTSACGSFCYRENSIDNGTECFGRGCCQSPIPERLHQFYPSFYTVSNDTGVQSFSPCSYAFIAEEDSFQFHPSYAKSQDFEMNYGYPMVLNWVVGQDSCAEARKKDNGLTYACKSTNSTCIDMPGRGYLCNCSEGYHGNPYLVGGCKDIDECIALPQPCKGGQCSNTIGNYTCTCPRGTHSNDPKSIPCTRTDNGPNTKVIGVSIGLICLVVCTFTVLNACQKRKLAKEKEKFFKQNGGQILYQQILSKKVDTVILFSIDDLKKATDNFDKSRELGIGGNGTVYKGILKKDNRVVAVKRSRFSNVEKAEEFVQEIVILSQINHRNVVRLLGCCLEVEVPILVYEYIPNGTLFQFIHGNHGSRPPVSLEARLKIAQESAEALSYLHLSTNSPIVHGDVKSLNILLDENYMAKVTDFGASRILPKDAVQLMTMVQGTLGYLDPEYLQERKLTEKSDVYSFGVVLLELITRKMAISFEGPEEEKSVASSFLRALKENRVEGMLDSSIMGVGMEELFEEVVKLASMCLSSKGEDRPSMTQVADKLKAIRSTWREVLLLQHQETEHLAEGLAAASSSFGLPPSMHWTAGMMGLDIEAPR
ncbi:hypothetical protein SETIT_4G030700v2 [Setaria italica]|uniref:Protein kinase domain-containing protein n=1 Tax=Setaria italica TaxID=4555 RepID=A0A368QQ81_SETIT|nr:wall-associated receptor kinase 1 [Setaria italica]RCV20121.1 hypothetical protein SETIT_4G030700v2 [Setaria italica]